MTMRDLMFSSSTRAIRHFAMAGIAMAGLCVLATHMIHEATRGLSLQAARIQPLPPPASEGRITVVTRSVLDSGVTETGSILRGANSIRIDPCTGQEKK
jgi:hypothetical protein